MRRGPTWCLGWPRPRRWRFRIWELWSLGYLPLPQRSPGIAAAVVGVALVLYGAGIGFGQRRSG